MKSLISLILCGLRVERSLGISLLGTAMVVIVCASLVQAQDPRLSSLLDTRSGEIVPVWNVWPDNQNTLRPVINDNRMVAFSAAYQDGSFPDWWQVYMNTSTPG